MQVLCLYGPRKSKPRLKSELRKQQYTVTLFDRKHLAHVIVLLANPKIYVLLYSFCFFFFFFFKFRTVSKQKPPRASIWRGDLSEGFLRYEFWGAYIWRGLYMEGLIFVILWYLPRETSEMFRHFEVTTETTQPRPQVSSVNGSIIWQFCCTTDVIFNISQNSSKFGRQQLVVMNYAWDFSQSEAEKYSELIMIQFI